MLAAVSSTLANADPRFGAVAALACISFLSGVVTIGWALARRKTLRQPT